MAASDDPSLETANAAPAAVAPESAADPLAEASFLDAVGAATERRQRAIGLAVLLALVGLGFFLTLFFGLARGFDLLARQASGPLAGGLAPEATGMAPSPTPRPHVHAAPTATAPDEAPPPGL